MGKNARWILAVTVGLLASIGVGASAAHYLQEPYNPGFLDFPTVVALHVVLGGVYLALAPFQFVRRTHESRTMARLFSMFGGGVGMSSFAAPILRFARTLRRAWMRGGDFRVLVYLVVLLLLGGTVFYTKQRKLPRIPYYSALG